MVYLERDNITKTRPLAPPPHCSDAMCLPTYLHTSSGWQPASTDRGRCQLADLGSQLGGHSAPAPAKQCWNTETALLLY